MGYEQLIGNPLFNMGIGETLPITYNWDHPDYVRKEPIWELCRDAVEGQDAIKKKGQEYLPKLSGQSSEEYENYLKRTLYYNATGRTKRSYEGMIFRRPPTIKVQDKKTNDEVEFNTVDYYKSITNKGESLSDLLRKSVSEIIVTNKVGILVNYSWMSEGNRSEQLSLYEKEKRGIKPRLTMYKAEAIRNWQYMYVGTTPVPIMYVIKEKVYDYSSDIFATETDIYRILCLEPYFDNEASPVKVRCKQITFKEDIIQHSDKPDEHVWQLTKVMYPKDKENQYLDYIPFYILTDKGIDFEGMENPMIYDLAELNISHYRNSADWENELHMIAAKTVYFPGWDKSVYGDPRFGGALAGPKDCKPEVIEASNKSGLSDEMQAKEDRMSVLGSEAISKQGRLNYSPIAS